MKLTRFRYNKMVCAVAVIGTVSVLTAGDLNPPPGPVGPTGRFGPRTEISDTKTPGDADSLFKIAQPGSYYLTSHITGLSGKSGIKIATSGVTVDLMGFEIAGVPGALDGISAASGVGNVVVRNGTIRDWPQVGVNLSNVTGGCVTDVVADQNSGGGIRVFDAFLVRACVARRNAIDGISAARNSRIVDCLVDSNTGFGIRVGQGGGGCAITGCVASNNTSIGIFTSTAVVTGCSAFSNGSHGIRATEGSTVVRCSASLNVSDGISAEQSTVVNCTAIFNSIDGIDAIDCLVQSNTSVSNSVTNIRTTTCTVLDNHASP